MEQPEKTRCLRRVYYVRNDAALKLHLFYCLLQFIIAHMDYTERTLRKKPAPDISLVPIFFHQPLLDFPHVHHLFLSVFHKLTHKYLCHIHGINSPSGRNMIIFNTNPMPNPASGFRLYPPLMASLSLTMSANRPIPVTLNTTHR